MVLFYTGFGATGKFWAHEHWNLSSPPDIVAFSKKAQTAGYFFGNDLLVPDRAYRRFSTWVGDPARVILCNAVIPEILERNLVGKCAAVGARRYGALDELASKHPEKIRNLRGQGCGTYIAFDTPDAAAIVIKMRSLAVNVGMCGKSTLRLRPMLTFTEDLIARLIQALDESIASLS